MFPAIGFSGRKDVDEIMDSNMEQIMDATWQSFGASGTDELLRTFNFKFRIHDVDGTLLDEDSAEYLKDHLEENRWPITVEVTLPKPKVQRTEQEEFRELLTKESLESFEDKLRREGFNTLDRL